MPAGVSWGQYTKFLGSALLAMMAGSQAVHLYYKPLDDLPVYIEREQHHHQQEQQQQQHHQQAAS
ncbi:protein BRAWNIN [Drosophila grimshawi]|uniref:GH12102 n=1 Tax=Drosophila grimshawi TaxID=7222 RepID=B4JK75_DROGR|nr:protein BRAWNIN [Drosophila grimshawi]EDV99977.1 GH12102 [Drosophila grimshawi]